MKTAFLLHGTGGNSSDYFWFEDTKNFLENLGYKVWWPELPNTKRPTLEESVSFVQQNMPEVDENTLIIGHSSACPLILSLLQRGNFKVNQVILVAGYYNKIEDKVSDLMIEKGSYDWNKIKNSAKEIIVINSDNDPWGCDDKQARPVAKNLGATFIFAKNQGHMGSSSFNQPYREHEIVKNYLKI